MKKLPGKELTPETTELDELRNGKIIKSAQLL
jgi:hypothetical protein